MLNKTLAVLFVLKGGRGSGNFGHRGREGKVGGSGSGVFLGMTSARPERQSKKIVTRDMRRFISGLQSLGVRVTSGRQAWGAWVSPETHTTVMEPSWFVSYEGNGEALKYVAQTAKKFNQEAVILWHKTDASDEQAVPRLSWEFANLSSHNIQSVNSIVAQKGLPGWTWDFKRKTLVAAAVSQWGSPTDFIKSAEQVSSALRKAGFKVRIKQSHVKSTVMDGTNYDEYARG